LLKRVFERSRRYLHYIVEELEKRGMPTELALLPIVESSFNPLAYSSARALGMWQFIPATGKTYKLQQNAWFDQRRDIVASTGAALDYLQTIYEMHGDWHLALASYNWGEGAVGRAVAKNRAKGLSAEYSSLVMPKETRFYVPKLQALKNIIAQPELFSFELDALPNRPYFDTMPLPGDMDVAVAAKLAEMPLEQFIALNPAYHRPLIRGDRGTQLVLPTDKIETFRTNLKRYEALDRPLTHWRTHTLKAGERLDSVAERYRLSLAGLHRINGITRRTKIQPGMNLLVPGPGTHLPEQVLAHLPAMPAESARTGKGAYKKPAAAGKARSKSTGSVRKPVNGRKR
jgi:membrane-bound lytic murein transglycosylase D